MYNLMGGNEICALIVNLGIILFPFQSFYHSFLQPDITVFKQNLAALEVLNSKHKLFSKVGVASQSRD